MDSESACTACNPCRWAASLSAATGDGENIFFVHVAAGANAKIAQDAAAAVEQDVGMRGIEFATWVKLREVIVEHAEVIRHRLQFAVAGFLARWANMVAFDEQHLCDGFAGGVQFRRVAAYLLTRCCRCNAGSSTAIADFHHAQTAVAAGGQARMMA